MRIHPLLDWTELNVWEYLEAEGIPVVDLYFDKLGTGARYRSLGCGPCTQPVESSAATAREIVPELSTGRFAKVAERAGRPRMPKMVVDSRRCGEGNCRSWIDRLGPCRK